MPDDQRTNRDYVPATFAGGTGGHPKTSGGYQKSRTNGPIDARAYNRKDQRYAGPEATLIANRVARAAGEQAGAWIAQGVLGRVEYRSPDGNNFEVNPDGTECTCPDRRRLDESGFPAVLCKHGYRTVSEVSAVGGFVNLLWSSARLAEVLGIARHTAAVLCLKGVVTAYKVQGNWTIEPDANNFDALREYVDKNINRAGLRDAARALDGTSE